MADSEFDGSSASMVPTRSNGLNWLIRCYRLLLFIDRAPDVTTLNPAIRLGRLGKNVGIAIWHSYYL
ncbi:hypothetical protein [Pantanalinema rosaneae]|uniref:hypothetical protein n=1 Tax=Pantanalinema rosaneae TaxID=1620701 RepID=UPI003D6E251A